MLGKSYFISNVLDYYDLSILKNIGFYLSSDFFVIVCFFTKNPSIIVNSGTIIGKKANGIYFKASICNAPEINVPLTPHGTIELTAAPASIRARGGLHNHIWR